MGYEGARRISRDVSTVPDCVTGTWRPFAGATRGYGSCSAWLGAAGASAGEFPADDACRTFRGHHRTQLSFGPLFINVRITKTDAPIRLRADLPFAQVHRFRGRSMGTRVLGDMSLAGKGLDDFGAAEWDDYSRTCSRNQTPDRIGRMAHTRLKPAKRRKSEPAGAGLIGGCPFGGRAA